MNYNTGISFTALSITMLVIKQQEVSFISLLAASIKPVFQDHDLRTEITVNLAIMS